MRKSLGEGDLLIVRFRARRWRIRREGDRENEIEKEMSVRNAERQNIKK